MRRHDALGGTFLMHIPTGHFFKIFDAGVQLYQDKPGSGLRQHIVGFQNQIQKGPFEFIGEMAHANIGFAGSSRQIFREGYYLQPSWRVAKGVHLYYRYDWMKFDSSDPLHPFADEHTAGINFRPVPTLSLKLEWKKS